MSESLDSIRVLHVDDDPDFSDLVATYLEREDDRIDVVTTTTPAEGLEHLSRDRFDCVVSDYNMAETDGLAFLAEVRADYPDLPFILFTGEGSEEVASEAISTGVTDYLQKETGTEQYELLANRIENVVSQHYAERQAVEQARILRIVRDLNQALLEADMLEEIERVTTDILAAADPYVLAWIGEYDDEWDRVVPRTAAGVDVDSFGPASVSEASTDEAALFEAFRRDGPVVASPGDPTLAVWVDERAPISHEEAVVVPLSYQGDRHGILALYADRAGFADESELDMLEEVGGDVAQAMQTARTNRRLRRHQTAVEVVPEGVFVLDEDATIELVNESGAALIDATPEDLQGEPFPTFVEAGIVDEGIIEWYLERVPEMLSSSSDREEAWYETRLTRPDGEERTIEVHLTLRPYDEEFRGTAGIIRDVTDRKRRERELEENKERYRRLVENAPVPIVLYDAEGTISYVNDAAISFVGAPDRESLFGESAMSFVHPDDQALAADRMETVLRDRTPVPATELSLVDRSGDRKEVVITSVPVTYENEPAAQVVIKDITEQKERERALQRQRDQLDEFASILSHDLRNPLNVASGRLELAREDRDGEHLEVVAEAHDRMRTLIDDLLALARAAESDPELEAVDLERVVEESWRTVATADAELTVEEASTIMADRGRLKQLLENLVRNAVEHGGEDVTVMVGTVDGGFYLADDGPGVPPDEREQIFEPGYSTLDSGSGFGLEIVERIADAHGWEIRVTEATSGGARFEITGVDVR